MIFKVSNTYPLRLTLGSHQTFWQGWGLFKTNVRIQWNLIYNAFHDPSPLYLRQSLYGNFPKKNFPFFFSWACPACVQPVQLTICFVSTRTNSMKCLIDWILLNSHVRFEQNPTLLEYCTVSYSSFATPGRKKKTSENGGNANLRMISAAAKDECDS